tara:strand:- start:3961 stop:6771 length:2811 start_codon:yes stop_codon:yes gene_type:complete
MANEIRYYNTPFSFVSPVRHFKANDPYYYEVDNIPIKQLEESQNFLKDQVDGIITKQNNRKEIEIDRSNFSELKPFATGNDRKVRVNPGRYTARINNAYTLTPLQVVEQVAGFTNTQSSTESSPVNTYSVGTNRKLDLQPVLNAFASGLEGQVLNMNGLAERAFVWPVDTEDGQSSSGAPDLLNVVSKGYAQFDDDFDTDGRPTYPNVIGSLLKHTTGNDNINLSLIRNLFSTEDRPSGSEQGRLESAFIKRWRGAIRTSIVDVKEELVIDVPDFDGEDGSDFFVVNEDGESEAVRANQRIDLLFIYSKAVDEESTTLSRFEGGDTPKTITVPTLGILKGAGIGISRQLGVNNNNADDRVSLQDELGTPLMLAHPGDEGTVNTTTNGFMTSAGAIQGSFPSPDDLMNLAPLLSENLESTAFPLIGQSILPIAYIRVQSDTGIISDLITDDDIIDIRPFFRTTELAYNERAGIAAATPQVSIANPVVTEAHLEKVRKEVYDDLSSRIATATVTTPSAAGGGGFGPGTRIIAAGTVLGGFYGPEGALMRLVDDTNIENITLNNLADTVESNFGYKAGSIGYLPNWDKARWYNKSGATDDGICDYINIGDPALTDFGPGHGKYLPPYKVDPETRDSSLSPLEEKSAAQVNSVFGNEPAAMYNWGPPTLKGPYVADVTTTSVAMVAADVEDSSMGDYAQQQGPSLQIVTTNAAGLLGELGRNLGQTVLNQLNARQIQLNYVTKRIQLDFTNTPWVSDYHVNVNLLNCVPLVDSTGDFLGYSKRNAAGVFVQKFKDHFIICVAWAGTNQAAAAPGVNGYQPWKFSYRNRPEIFAGFVQPTMEVLAGGSPITTPDSTRLTTSLNLDTINAQGVYNALNDGLGPAFGSPNGPLSTPDFFPGTQPILYPSVSYEVIGVTGSANEASHGGDGRLMYQKDPTLITR